MEELGIMDSAVTEDSSLAVPADPGTDSTDSTTEEQPVAEEQAPEEAPAVTSAKLIEAGKLSAEAKQTIAEIKAKNPALANQLQRALFKADAIDKVLPGGLRQAQELQKQIADWGGPEKVQQTREELAYFSDLDAQFTAGDPRFITAMIDTPAGQEAFQKLAPAMFDKYLEMNPEGYGAYVSKVFIADMVQERIPLALERLQDFLPADKPQALAAWKEIQQYINRINKLSQQPVAPTKASAAKSPEVDARAAELDKREQDLTRTEWRRESDSDRLKVFTAEWAKLTAGRKLTDIQTAAVKELYASRLHNAASRMPEFNENLQKYFAAGDKAGFMRYLSSVHKAEVPRALKAAMDAILPSRPGPKPGTPPQVALPKEGGIGKPAPGFEFIGKRPDPNEIDPIRSVGLILQGKAVLRSGKKVYWRT